ncbi:hypothetical protein STEG23_018862 [Scotinomys teguina]
MTERHPFKSEAEEGAGEWSKGLTVIARTDENPKSGIKLSVMPIAKPACHQPDPKQAIKKETGTVLTVNAYPTVVRCSEIWGVPCDNWALSGAISTVCALVVPALEARASVRDTKSKMFADPCSVPTNFNALLGVIGK